MLLQNILTPSYSALGIGLLSIIYVLWKVLSQTDQPKIKGLPEIPGWPIFGSLFELGTKHPLVTKSWSTKYGPVFQARLGNKRIVFANTFDSVYELWVKNQSALISRPKLHTFHTVVSDSSNFTIGTSPWDESCKRRRKAAATALNVPAVKSYMPIIDLESFVSIKELLQNSKYGEVDIDPAHYFQRYALNTSLTLNYGFRIEGNIDDKLLREIVHVERGVSNFRSTSNNWADYVPILRWVPGSSKNPIEFKERRAKYMKHLLDILKERIANGTDKPCITGTILKDPETKLNDAEIDSIGLSMVSAGLDTVPGNVIMGLAFLSSPEGQVVQRKSYEEIMRVYPNGEGWHKCLDEEKVPYVTAFYKEVLRYWSVIPISLPRVSIKEIQYNDTTIPAGMMFYMNAYGANYDESHFKEPYKFIPERYLKTEDDVVTGTPHFAYGAGSRMCAGSHLANRELFVAFVRLISAFEIVPPKDLRNSPIMDALEANVTPTGLTMEPKPFKIGFKVRDRQKLEQWLRESEDATRGI